MFEVGIRNRLRAVHFLRGDFAEESLPHEHEYLVEWVLRTNVLDENGFSVDIALMQEFLGTTVAELDGRTLNELEFFAERQVSVENLAVYLQERLFEALKDRGYPVAGILLSRVQVWESETAWAAYIDA
jgi:6-pyruvoyltetrahydropterin/6-carboxytetrahydropterin synthase